MPKLIQSLASLKLTIVVFFAALILILAGTLAQVERGLWVVLDEYFRSWYVPIPLELFALFLPGEVEPPGVLPFPGGATIGLVLLINLVAAHGLRFKVKAKGRQKAFGTAWIVAGVAAICAAFFVPPITNTLAKNIVVLFALGSLFFIPLLIGCAILFGQRMGIVLIHASLITLLLGEGVTALKAHEMQMPIFEGQTVDWAHDIRESELVIIAPAPESAPGSAPGKAPENAPKNAPANAPANAPGSASANAPGSAPGSTSETFAGEGPGSERVWAIRQHALERAAKTGELIQAPGMPLKVKVDRFMINAAVVTLQPGAAKTSDIAMGTHGLSASQNVALVEQREASGVRAGQSINGALVTLIDDHGHTAGQYVVSPALQTRTDFFIRQAVHSHGDTYDVAMRFRRFYQPYQVQLEDFRHDLYPGTNTPRNFSSDIIITAADIQTPRKAHIRMNEPLRFRGKTFFQASYMPDDTGTVLQIVRNPGWTIPYISCIVGGLGLTVHFILSLLKFGKKDRKQAAKTKQAATKPLTHENPQDPALPPKPAKPWIGWIPTGVVTAITLFMLVVAFLGAETAEDFDGFNVQDFGRLMITNGGRPKPMDSVARDTMLALSGKSSVKEPAEKDAVHWLLDTWTGQPQAATDRVFRIDHRDLKHLIGIDDSSRKFFSRDEVAPHLDAIRDAFNAAQKLDQRDRSAFDRGAIELYSSLVLYGRIATRQTLHIPAPALTPAPAPGTAPGMAPGMAPGNTASNLNAPGITPVSLGGDGFGSQTPKPLKTVGQNWAELAVALAHQSNDPLANAYLNALLAYQDRDRPTFNAQVAEALILQQNRYPWLQPRMDTEQRFNQVAPYTQAIAVYILATLCVLVSWIVWHRPMIRAATVLIIIGFVVQSVALILRMYLSGRPPVTNLYSSAVFIGWGVVGLGLLLEYVTGLGLGLLVSAGTGIGTLLVAKGLETGDTMNVMQAVLDTNFWLATHVITITFGYSATFVAMAFGIIYILGGLFTKALADKRVAKRITGVIYGTTCFALLLSFIGTILGGIWADQSWGRFWGWDPKENGALMIVIWTALILHARWGGIVKGRGIAVLATLGGMVTIWSWFGTNLLGTGLHSYGFMDGAFFWVRTSFLALIVIAAFATVPTKDWRSFREPDPKQ